MNMEFTKLFSITSSEPWIQEIEAKALYNEPVVDENGNYNFVYCCINLDTHWCYVGKQTCWDPYDQEYVGSSKNKHYWKSRNKHLYKKLFLGYCKTEQEAYDLEAEIVNREFLDKYSENGIFNLQVGGNGGIILSPELLKLRGQEISAAKKGVPLSKEHRMAISVANYKRYEDPEEHKKTSDANYKRFKDPNERGKLSNAQKKRYEDPKERKKTSDANYKRFEDPNKRQAHLEVMNRLDVRQLMSDSHTGVPLSEKHRQAQSEAQYKRYEDPNERQKVQAGKCMYCIKKSLDINPDPTWDEFVTNLPKGHGVSRSIETIISYLDLLRQRPDWTPVMERLFSSQGY